MTLTNQLAGAQRLQAAISQTWDAVVVGTGMGGATIGHQLATSGKRVLFCELGGAGPADRTLTGEYPELAAGRSGQLLTQQDSELLMRAGRWPFPVRDETPTSARSFLPFVGCGPGGSSAIYGMALERFSPDDFNPASLGPYPHDALVADAWPIQYGDLAPYYARVEELFGVRGTIDPLAAARLPPEMLPRLLSPPALSGAAAELESFLSSRDLHPYRLPVGCEHVPDCRSCQGYLCPRECKRDAANTCLRPAIERHGAELLSRCRATALRVDGRRAVSLACLRDGTAFELRAKAIVLAAGAMQTPSILQASDIDKGAKGIGRTSGLVGRCLMRHFIDLYLVRPDPDLKGDQFDNRRKELACNDFYVDEGVKLGTLQSFGRLPPAAMLWSALQDDVAGSPWRAVAPMLPLLGPLMQRVLSDMSEGWLTLASIIEDLPYRDNLVTADHTQPPAVTLRYGMRPEALQRVGRFRGHMRRVLRGRKWRLVKQAANNQRIAHVCGTCRFGDDPRTSVLDRFNRVHELDNVFVVDSSFFPSSGGTNPSLTIAANAMRVGVRIASDIL